MSDRLGLPASTRKKIDTALDKLIALLDAIDGDPDLEESDPREPVGDDEPSLGATEALNQERAWRATVAPTDLEFDGDNRPDADKEPSLGSPEYLGLRSHVDQEDWARSRGSDDRELEADDEPSLGSLERRDSQIAWSAGSDDDCEAEHDGREPDEDLEWDQAEAGIGDSDGAQEQFGRCE